MSGVVPDTFYMVFTNTISAFYNGSLYCLREVYIQIVGGMDHPGKFWRAYGLSQHIKLIGRSGAVPVWNEPDGRRAEETGQRPFEERLVVTYDQYGEGLFPGTGRYHRSPLIELLVSSAILLLIITAFLSMLASAAKILFPDMRRSMMLL